uniref:Uncharacterized protein n=1 Tax=Phaeomonas parva TaxID=124430 RepID=A0A7S1U2S6_9STRA|mmetsp:Transcript_28914/g.92399  ORF Transcript_28914/g.92399 Transcript_28914/m.92399 type:complete len:255 (+) Transcript_28914:275-1039(+)
MGNTLNQLEDKLNEAMAGKKSAPDVVAVPPELVTAASAAPGPLSTVHAVQILNGEWAANQCDLKDNWAGVKCSNLRAAMAQVGLPAPEEAKAAPLKVDYGPPTLVSEPTQLIAEADAALAKACAERCGFLASALGAAFGGVASYSGFTGSFPAAEGAMPSHDPASSHEPHPTPTESRRHARGVGPEGPRRALHWVRRARHNRGALDLLQVLPARAAAKAALRGRRALCAPGRIRAPGQGGGGRRGLPAVRCQER